MVHLHEDPAAFLHAPDTPVTDVEPPIVLVEDTIAQPHAHLHLNAVEGGLAAAGGGPSLAPPSPGRAEKRLVSHLARWTGGEKK